MNQGYWQEDGSDYARYRPTYPEALAKALAQMAPDNGLAIDVGCGTGQLSALLANHFNKVIGIDVSRDQLTNASQHSNITYKTGTAEEIDVPDASADLIVAAQAAHWFDLPAFYKEARRIGRPQAVLALVTYGVVEAEGPAAQRIKKLYWDEIHPFWPEGRQNVENGYRDFDFPFKTIDPPSLDITREWSVDHFINYCQTWSAAKRALKAGRGDILAKAEEDLKNIVGTDGKIKISWPISIRAGIL